MTEKIFEYPDEVLAEQLGMSIGKSCCEDTLVIRGENIFFEPKIREQVEAEERAKKPTKSV